MRKLQTKDVFNALRIIKKAELKEELKPFIKQVAESKDKLALEDVGIDGILTVFEILVEKKAEQGVYDFLAGPFEMESKEVEAMELNNLVEKLKELAGENNLKVFFTSLSGMIGKK